MNIRILSEDDVRECISMRDAIDLMAGAFAALSDGSVQSPLRTVLSNDKGTVLYKPAYWAEAELFCCKTVSVFGGNSRQGLPVTAGVLQVNDAATGLPIALMDAGYITSLRTGAATGLATKLIAREDAKIAALFGTGGQARHQLEAQLCVRQLERVYIFSRKIDNARQFCESNRDLADVCELVPTDELQRLKECDIINTATTSPVPLFEHEMLPARTHINSVGSLGIDRREIASETVLASAVCVDQRAACLTEAGEFRIVKNEGRLPDNFNPVEIGELVAGTAKLDDKAMSFFRSVGNAAQDIACVRHILPLAASKNLGSTINL